MFGASTTRASRRDHLLALPAEGRPGNPPAFPMPKITRWRNLGQGVRVADQGASTTFRAREIAIWRQVWKTPQARAWDLDPWRWSTIAEFCRLKAVTEADPDTSAALLSRLREYRNEIGLSPDGMRANGWVIARDEVAARRHQRQEKPVERTGPLPTRRLRATTPPASDDQSS